MSRKNDQKLGALTEFEALLVMGDKVSFERGKMIFKEGEKSTDFYILLKGKVAIGKKASGGEIKAIAELSEGDFLGEGVLSGVTKKPASAKALTKVTAMKLTKAHFEKLKKEAPDTMARFLMAVLGVSNSRLEKTDAKLMALFEISYLLNIYRYELRDLAAGIIHKLIESTESKDGLLMLRNPDKSYRVIYSTSHHFNEGSLKKLDLKKPHNRKGLMIAPLKDVGVLALKRKTDFEDDQLRFLMLIADQVAYNIKEAARRADEQARQILSKY